MSAGNPYGPDRREKKEKKGKKSAEKKCPPCPKRHICAAAGRIPAAKAEKAQKSGISVLEAYP
jgi:hypothetical protein